MNTIMQRITHLERASQRRSGRVWDVAQLTEEEVSRLNAISWEVALVGIAQVSDEDIEWAAALAERVGVRP